MKKPIIKLEDILASELQNLYNGERVFREKIKTILPFIESEELKSIVTKYAESCDHKRLKLDRMFSYLLVEPSSKENIIMSKLIEETELRLNHTSDRIKCLALLGGLQLINYYKIASYRVALVYSLELELDTVADLLHQIIEWERKTEKGLTELLRKEFCKSAVQFN